MTATHEPGNCASQIPAQQNQPHHLERLRAYSRLYDIAARWRRLRIAGTVLLAVLGPTLALLAVDTVGVLAAISAAWLVLGRAVLVPLETRAREQAVKVQELFDTKLFGLTWNAAIAGDPPLADDIACAARAMKDDPERFNDWYDVDLAGLTWPTDVAHCQRQAMAWSRSDHRAYATTLALTASSWAAIGILIALTQQLSLAEYLVKLFLPTAPALLDTIEQQSAHRRHATERESHLSRMDELIRDRCTSTTTITEEQCRQIQDSAYLLRCSTPRVPGWFYRMRRQGVQGNTAAASQSLRTEE